MTTLTPLLRLIPDFQAVHDFGKVGTTNALFVPAFDHQGVNCTWTCFGTSKKLAGANHVDDFLVAVTEVGLDAIGVDFP